MMVERALVQMSDGRPNLRHMFVGMLFALTASQIAISTAELFRGISAINDIATVWAPATHLLLALIVLTASWVGWSETAAATGPRQLEHVFQWSYFVLILDVVLVIIYYMFVLSVEYVPSQTPQVVPSALEETTLVVLIFATYCVWDVLHDILMLRATRRIRAAVVQASASVISLGFAGIVWWNYRTLAAPNHVTSVVSADVALIALLFFFRALKGLEVPLGRVLGADVVTKERSYNWKLWVAVWGVVWFVAVLAMNITQPAQASDVVPRPAERATGS